MKDEPNSSLVRGIDTLVGLAEAGRPVAFSVLGASLRMPPSTVHRILQSLRKAGYVTQDPATGSYSPGPAFLQAAAIFSSASTLPRSIESALQTLVSGSGESAYFGLYLPRSQRMRFLTQVYSDHAVHYVLRTDEDYSLLWGASGRSIAAFVDAKVLRALYERGRKEAEGKAGLPAWREFQAEMKGIRDLGYCTTYNQRFEGAHSVAAPVIGAGGSVLGCIGICMPSMRRNPARIEALGAMVKDAARQVSVVAQCVIDQPSLHLGGESLR
jgi:DNA-binding IclR family transcriptional regulator